MANTQNVLMRFVADDEASKVIDSIGKATKRQTDYTSNLIKRLKEEAIARRDGTKALELYRARMNGATDAQIRAIQKLQAAHIAAEQGNHRLGRSSKYAGAMMGQMGHQVQDIAVQLQMGTSAGLVFAQQGSQIASLMGPTGPLYGALFAIVGALGTYIMANRDAEKVMNSVSQEADKYITSFENAGAATKAFAEADLRKNMAENQQKIIEADAAIQTHLDGISLMTDRYGEASVEVENHRSKLDLARRARAAAQDAVARQKEALEGLTDEEREAIKTVDDHWKALHDQTAELYLSNRALYERELLLDGVAKAERDAMLAVWDANQAAITQREEERALIDALTKEDQARYDKAVKASEDRRDALIKETLAIQDQMDAELQAKRAAEEAAQAKRDEKFGSDFTSLQESLKTDYQIRAEAFLSQQALLEEALDRQRITKEQHAAMMSQITQTYHNAETAAMMTHAGAVMGIMGQQAGTLSTLFDQASGLGKAFYLVQQTMAAGQAIIDGYKAASAIRVAYAEMAAMTANPGLIAAGNAHATMATMMGFATAGAIMGQTIGSFEGGGYIADGPRAGGLDGRGGMAAIVHRGESIVDHRAGQGARAVSVNFTIQANDTEGFDKLLESRRGQIVSLVSRALANNGRRL